MGRKFAMENVALWHVSDIEKRWIDARLTGEKRTSAGRKFDVRLYRSPSVSSLFAINSNGQAGVSAVA